MISHPNVKVNVGLNVIRKREDGYHDIETLFVPYFAISDTLEIIRGDDYSRTSAHLFEKYTGQGQLVQGIRDDGKLMISIAREDGVDWDPLKDLTAKAYDMLDRDFNLPPAKIFLEKTSPVGAGLGGGSSDAAFALRMISELFGLNLDDSSLAGYASGLGSDCAFFIYNRPMAGSGRGEILEDFNLEGIDFGNNDSAAEYVLKVVVPEGISVSTADAYRGILPKEPAIPVREILRRPVNEWRDLLRNDFESTVFKKHPSLASVKENLYELGAVYASMSGSGSAMYGIFHK